MPNRPIIIITRPQAQAVRFAADVAARFGDRVQIVLSPVMEIEQVPIAVDAEVYDGFIFTSENGVTAFAAQAKANGRVAYCVGERTAEVAKNAGFETYSAEGDAGSLVDMIARINPSGRLLHPRGEHARGMVAQTLCQKGLRVEETVLYRQIARPLTADARAALRKDACVILPLFSPRTAKLLREQLTNIHAQLCIIAMSAAVASEVGPELQAQMTVVDRPEASAILDAIGAFV